MNPQQSSPLTRRQIGEFIPSERGIRAFEAVQGDTSEIYNTLISAQFLTVQAEPSLGAERVLTPATGQLTGTDGGAGGAYTLGLADTTVVAGAYGAATKTISVVVDAKGRLTGVTAYTLSTSNVTEGSNLYFTNARAQAALSGGVGIAYNSGTGLIALDTTSSRNVKHDGVTITAGTGLTGGGDLTVSRTISLANTTVTPGTYSPVSSITVDAQGRITAIS